MTIDARYVSHNWLLEQIQDSTYLGSGSDRMAVQLKDGNVLKLPASLYYYCYEVAEVFHENWNYGARPYDHTWNDLQFPVITSLSELDDYEMDTDGETIESMYCDYLAQSLKEALISQNVDSPLFTSMVDCGFTDTGFFFSIWEPIEVAGEGLEEEYYGSEEYATHGNNDDWAFLEYLLDSGEYNVTSSDVWDELNEIENQSDIEITDIISNTNNWGIKNGKFLICDLGYGSSNNWRLQIAG